MGRLLPRRPLGAPSCPRAPAASPASLRQASPLSGRRRSQLAPCGMTPAAPNRLQAWAVPGRRAAAASEGRGARAGARCCCSWTPRSICSGTWARGSRRKVTREPPRAGASEQASKRLRFLLVLARVRRWQGRAGQG